MSSSSSSRPSVGQVVIRGCIGGLFGAYLMRVAVRALAHCHKHEARYGVFGLDREADVRSLQLVAHMALRKTIDEKQAERLAAIFHYSYGALGGVAYPLLADPLPQLRLGCGTGFGAVVWLLGDELPIAAFGISDPLRKSPLSHLYALLTHLLYGFAVHIFAYGMLNQKLATVTASPESNGASV